MKRETIAGVVLVLAGAVGLMRAADPVGGEDQPESPARAAFRQVFAASPVAFRAELVRQLDADTSATAVQK